MPGNVSFILAREHGRVVCWGGSWPMLHGSRREDGMREGLVARSPSRRWLQSSRWEVKGPCWHGGIGRREEEIHSDKGSHPRDRSPKSPWARWRQAPTSALGTWILFSTDGNESHTYLSGLLRRLKQ